MRHQDLTLNHRIESWVFADATARNAAGSYVSGDVGRIGFQTNTSDYWRLLTVTPTWKRLNGIYASVQTAQATPATTTAVTPGIMLGLGANAHLTPTVTGKILVTFCGTIINTTAGKLPFAQMRYGTGTAPAFGAVGTTGTQVGGAATLTGNTANNASPFSLTGLITSAALATNLWFDLQLYTDTGGTAWVAAVTCSAVELP